MPPRPRLRNLFVNATIVNTPKIVSLFIVCLVFLWSGTGFSAPEPRPSAPVTLRPEQILELLDRGEYSQIEAAFLPMRNAVVTIDGPYPELEKTYTGIADLCDEMPPDERAVRLDRLKEWKQAEPGHITPVLLAAYIHLERADRLREGKPLSELPEAAAEMAKTEAKLAQSQLLAVKGLADDDVTYYAAAIRVATGVGKPLSPYSGAYKTALEKKPDYRPLYLWMARHIRETHQNQKEWMRFLDDECSRWPGIPGDVLYCRMLRTLGPNQISDLLWANILDYARLKRGQDELLRRDPDDSHTLNFRVFCAWMAGDSKLMRATYPLIGERWDRSMWNGEESYKNCGKDLNKALTLTPGLSRMLLETGDFAQLQEIYLNTRSQLRDRDNRSPLYCYHKATCDTSDQLSESNLATLEGYMLRWQEAVPESPLPLIYLGKIEITRAWKDRGSGYADTVTEEGWKGFYLHLERATAHLQKATSLAPPDPETYAALLIVAKGQGWPKSEMMKLVRAGAAIDPDYYSLYTNALDYLAPKWGGSEAEQVDFIKQVSDDRGGREGDGLYAQLCKSYKDTVGWPGFFANSGADYPRLKAGYLFLREKSPENRHLLHIYAVFACLAHDRPTAASLLNEIGDDFVQSYWLTPAIFKQWQEWAKGNGPPADD